MGVQKPADSYGLGWGVDVRCKVRIRSYLMNCYWPGNTDLIVVVCSELARQIENVRVCCGAEACYP